VFLAVNTVAGDCFSSPIEGCRLTLVEEFIAAVLQAPQKE
jgi:hypothetical protein